MKATIDAIKDLRNRTGAGVGSVKEALEASDTIDAAITYLRQKGVAKAAKRASKEAVNGTIGTYVHSDNRTIVLVEVATETDFASKGEAIQKFAKDLALHIAAENTEYVSQSAVPAEIIQAEKDAAAKEVEGKPEEIATKIMEGKISKFYQQNVLLNQKLFTDDSKTVADYLNEVIAQIGEKIQVRRFVRMQLGQDLIISEQGEE